jgi:ketosteroid isomerase-like protein
MGRLAIQISVSLLTFIIGIAVAAPFANPRVRNFFGSSAEAEVLSVEREYIDAHLRRDAAALDRILSDDFAFAHFWGKVSNKADRLALMEDPDFEFVSIDTRDVNVAYVREDYATVTGKAVVRVRHNGEVRTSPTYRFMRTYQKRQGRWQIVSVQSYRNCSQ